MNPRWQVAPTFWPRRLARSAVRFVLVSVLLPSCAPRQIIVERAPQAYYQTAFPLLDASRQLERIHESVKRVHFTAEYQTFVFTKEAGVTSADNLLSPAVLALAVDTLIEVQSKSGTASILARARRGMALLTNQHVVHYPAVRIQYFDERPARVRSRSTPRHVASVAIRTQDRGTLPDHPNLGRFEVLVRDSVNDLALLEVRFREDSDTAAFDAMPVAPGDPERLSWGSFVYVIGYPRGYPMVTFGIISDPNRDRTGSFLTNGLWNEGISGGAILAVRGDTGRLEWVGIARAGAGAAEIRLQPLAGETADELDLPLVYEGPLFVESVLRIQYGITFSVPMTLIRSFVSDNGRLLAARGYDPRGWY
ncbi:MAG: S1 family peptidase [Candidatus Limnocylindria bacterium]